MKKNYIKTLFASAIVLPALVACSASDKAIEDWVTKNPEKIMKSLMDHQRDQQEANMPKPEMVKDNQKALFENSTSPSVGNGKVQIAYFFDFNCGHCKRQGDTIKEVISKNGDNVQIVYKNFPVLGESSEMAARAALAAHQQGKYQEYYQELWETREKTMDQFKKIAQKLKLDVGQWETDMNSEKVVKELDHVRELAEKMKIRGTPFLAIAPDKIFPGRVDQLGEIVQALL